LALAVSLGGAEVLDLFVEEGNSGGTSRPSSLPKDSKKSPAIKRFNVVLAASTFISGLPTSLGIDVSSSSSESSEKIACTKIKITMRPHKQHLHI
jgi:hypothetical protein